MPNSGLGEIMCMLALVVCWTTDVTCFERNFLHANENMNLEYRQVEQSTNICKYLQIGIGQHIQVYAEVWRNKFLHVGSFKF